jgi:parvulin-like peptidyl-prolyl isomerase
MKWMVCLIAFLFSVDVSAQKESLYIKVNQENLRAAPNGSKIGEVMAGTKVNVLERQSKWVKVAFTGWIWAESLTSDSTQIAGFKIRASHILLKTQEEAAEILQRLKNGESFEALARQYSIDKASGARGGDLGEFGRGDLRPEFEEAAFKLKVGALSGVVQSPVGYHIIKRTK